MKMPTLADFIDESQENKLKNALLQIQTAAQTMSSKIREREEQNITFENLDQAVDYLTILEEDINNYQKLIDTGKKTFFQFLGSLRTIARLNREGGS